MKVALDIGNSAVKGSILQDDNTIITDVKLPSAITHITDSKYLNFTLPDDYYIQVVDSPLAHFDNIVAIGKVAMAMKDYKEFDVTSTSLKADHPITTSLLFGAIAGVVKDGEVDVKLAVSIPIVESKVLGLAKQYSDKLKGKHVVLVHTADGIGKLVINIETAIVMNEGQAGFLGMLDTVDVDFRTSLLAVYSSLGEPTDPVETFENFLIVDIGEGTTDLAVFRDKRFNPEYSYSVTRGYGNLLEDAIERAGRENLTIESRKDLQRLLESDNRRHQERKAKWMEYVLPSYRAFIDSVVSTILKTYGTRDYFDAIIFLGGGFSALTGYSVDFEKGIQMRDAHLFNELEKNLSKMKKTADLIFGIPQPYSQSINERGLVQVLSQM